LYSAVLALNSLGTAVTAQHATARQTARQDTALDQLHITERPTHVASIVHAVERTCSRAPAKLCWVCAPLLLLLFSCLATGRNCLWHNIAGRNGTGCYPRRPG
jgi:hypothetical protein